MSAFEVAVTPPRIRNAQKVSASREPTDVVLGLFSAKSIVTFEDIPVTKTARRTLHIHNPTDDVLKVLVTRTVNPIANAQLEWTSNEIPGRGHISMDIVWNPTVVWSTREIIQFTDNRNFKKDVAVILKSIDKKQNSKTTLKKSLGIKAGERVITKKLALKSPSPRTKSQRSRLSTLAAVNCVNNKKELPMNAVVDQQKKVLGMNNQSNGFPNVSIYTAPQIIEKENMKPQSPPNMSTVLDALKFTPAGKSAHNTSNTDYLASLPTPNSHLEKNQSYCVPSAHIYQNLNETETIMSTPLKVNDLTTVLGSFQTPIDRTEVNHTRYFDNAYDRDQFAMQKTPAFNEVPSFHFHLDEAPSSTADMFAVPNRKLNLDIPNVSPHNNNDKSLITNRTQTLSSPIGIPKLSIIEEEQSKIEMSETYVKPNEHHLTYNVEEEKLQPTENLVRDIRLISTPLSKKYLSMKELTDSNLSLEQKFLKINQGSMPNLHKLEAVKSIENNRYFYQSIEKDLQETENARNGDEEHNENLCDTSITSICSVQSTVSTLSVAFHEHEIQAQSSRLNLNEIGQNKVAEPQPTNLCFIIDKPTPKATSGMSRFKTSNKYLSASSPNVNKVFEKPKLSSQSIRDISSSAKSRPSVIAYANSNRSALNNSSALKKRTRDDKLNSSSKSLNKLSPPKRVCIEPESPKTKGQAFRTKTWGGIMPKKFRIPSIPPQRLQLKRPEEERVFLYDPELHMRSVINPDPFAATTTLDPFLSLTMYLDERAVDKHEIQFKKWLNALVTIPGEMDESANQPADVAKLFNEVQNKDCTLAPTKEMVSSNYLTKYRLASLRTAAIQLILSPEMQEKLGKLAVHVEKKLIQIRQDRNLHLDVVLQRSILELLLKFNPLWLRIGLEAVFGESIPMHNNHDMVALSSFILNRLFRDRYLESKHPKVYAQGDVYGDHIKKHTLKKMISLLYFLDVAKNKKIIKHNPCLFLKSSEFKETKEILLRFSSSLLGNIGDIQRDLKRIGIVLIHKQTYIDEFDYAFRNLAIDLRDGVRLTKVMEIILMRDDLTCQLRVPAISRTQRVHNVNLALNALQQADFALTGKITPNDIADGHREKTLSLLWQIIYQFRAPKFHAAATVIQIWWRKHWLGVCIRRRIRAKVERARNQAATKIQAAFRGYLGRKYAKQYLEQRTQAAITIQRYVRRMIAIGEFMIRFNCILFIQRWYRNQKLAQMHRQEYLKLRRSCITIQKWYRKILLSRRIERLVVVAREVQEQSKITYRSAVKIQQKFRGYLQMKRERSEYLQLKQATVTIQRRFRAQIEMHKQKRIFERLVEVIVNIQQKFRANLQMKIERASFVALKISTVRIQKWYRACQQRDIQRTEYLRLKQATMVVQNRFRALRQMRTERERYLRIQNATQMIQSRFKAYKLMKEQRTTYLALRKSAVCIQSHYRALIEMRNEREKYVQLKKSVIVVQQRYRANMLARATQNEYQKKRAAVLCIQQRLRAQNAMLKQRQEYLQLRWSVIVIQKKVRATILMKKTRLEYQILVKSAIVLQSRVRANRLAAQEQAFYQQLKMATIKVQQRFRANRAMKSAQFEFNRLKKAAICIQKQFRANRLMKMKADEFAQLKSAAIIIQRRFRAQRAKQIQQMEYNATRNAIIAIQRQFRANVLMKKQRTEFMKMKEAAICIQYRLRATLLMRRERSEYLLKRSSAIYIQRCYHDLIETRHQRVRFLIMRRSIVNIQRFFRGYLETKRQRQEFLALRSAAVTIQQHFRAQQEMLHAREQYQIARTAAIKIQIHFRSYTLMKRQREEFVKLHAATVCLQQRFRAQLLMRKQRTDYLRLQYNVILMQRRYRAKLLMKKIQAQYKLLKCLVICIQRKFRALIVMREERANFLRLKWAAVVIQQKIRAKLTARRDQKRFQRLQEIAVGLQAHIRGYLARKHFKSLMTPELVEKRRQNKAAKKIQSFWRGYRIRKTRSPMLRDICEKAKYLQKHALHKNTVGQRVKGIVYFLKSRFNAKDAYSILKELEIISLNIPHTLIHDSTFIGSFCYGIMSQAIRSEVDKQIISLCCRVLLNLARYKPTQQNVFQIHHFETVAQILYRWCDKDCDIFNVLCTVLYVFIQCPTINKQMRDFMVTREAIFLLREAKKLVARKERMRSITPPAWMPVLTPKEKRTLPMLETNFGVRSSKNYMFNCSIFGLDTILSQMNIIT
ncbi:protein abnormal spindle [Sitodiplosis mosellana]|uniref:protein abnormal spindle n=1 Tax=Sitodiplosis mosellana TaxID=263140 RepID=UPI002444F334|nr:protein abnormal spindle [Sitodiplosis mosellana]